MKVLVDGCVWGGAKPALVEAGHEVEAAADWERDPGDAEVLAHAHREGQVLVTIDKDFGELAIVRRQPHGGIVRLVTLRAEDHGPVAVATLEQYRDELQAGAIITVEPGRVRVRLQASEERSIDEA